MTQIQVNDSQKILSRNQ